MSRSPLPARLSTRRTPASTPRFDGAAALVGRDRRGDRAARGRRSSPTCARAATPRCSSTRAASTARRADDGGARARRRPSCTPRFDALARRAARRARSRRRAASAASTSASSRPAAESWSYRDADGTLLGQKVTPLDRVGIYVPGGKAAYPSSVLMNAIPAQVAGVGEIVMVVPTPRRREATRWCWPRPHVAGVDRVFTIGGAQAIGALAYGTATIPAVDKITGPGNAYVASAKRRVFGTVGIDMIAGPSEILVLADGRRRPTGWRWTCSARPSTTSWRRASCSAPTPATSTRVRAGDRAAAAGDAARATIIARLARRPRRADPHALMEEACAISNRIAPEHLEVSAREPHRWEPLLRHAGAIFLGAFTSESLGDYCAGPNHVLPTAGTARFSSPLGVYDFQKRTSLIEVSERGAAALGADRRRAGARRRPARRTRARPSCASKEAARERRTSPAPAPLRARHPPGRAVHARLRDPAERRAGQARRDGEPVPPARDAAARARRRLGAVAINRYPARCVGDVIAALASTSAAGRLQADARQRLGRADLAAGAWPATCPARRSWRRCPAS